MSPSLSDNNTNLRLLLFPRGVTSASALRGHVSRVAGHCHFVDALVTLFVPLHGRLYSCMRVFLDLQVMILCFLSLSHFRLIYIFASIASMNDSATFLIIPAAV